MTAKPLLYIDSRQCPICHGADQHVDDCVLKGKEHVYFSPDQVDWEKTLKKNGIK